MLIKRDQEEIGKKEQGIADQDRKKDPERILGTRIPDDTCIGF
jgi:hypothetical protein